MVRRDLMRMHAETEHAQAVRQIVLPDGLAPSLEILAAPDVVDENIETALLGADAIDQRRDLGRDEMIDPNGDAVAAGRRDQLGGLLDGLRQGMFGWPVAGGPSGQ
jgi:hypothetical protein